MTDFDPESNRFLVELKRRWEAGKYDQDREGIYPVIETLDQADFCPPRKKKVDGTVGAKCLICGSREHRNVDCPNRVD